MGIELAKAFVTVRADSSKVRGDLARAKGPIRAAVASLAADAARVGAAWSQAAASIGAAGTRMIAVAGIVGAVVIKTFANFESQMVQVGIVTLATKDDLLKLEKAARKAGATTQFTATQSAEAIEQLGLAGLKTNKIIAALPGTLDFAAAASIDLATAADIATGGMKAFKLETTDLGRVSDAYIVTQSKTKTNILQLAEAFKPVAGLADEVGLSLEQTAAILGKMADGMIRGSEAGVALRIALRSLINPTGDAKKILKEMGIETTDSILVRLEKFKIALDKLESPTDRVGLAMKVFGRGANAMIAALVDGVEGIKEFERVILSFSGITADAAAKKINTLSGQFLILRSMIEDIQITTGGKLNPTLRKMVEELQGFIKINADKMAEGLAVGLKAVAFGLRDAFIGFKDLLPALKEAGQMMLTFLRPMFQFLKENPRILGALLALKITGFLGLNTAVGQTARALGVTLMAAFSKVGTGLVFLVRRIGLFNTAMFGIAVGVFLFKLNAIRSEIAKTVEAAEEANRRLLGLEKKRRERRGERIEDAPIGLKREALEKGVAEAKRDFKAANISAAGEEKSLRDIRAESNFKDTIIGFFSDSAEEIQQRAVDEANKRTVEALRNFRELRQQLRELPEEDELPVRAPVPTTDMMAGALGDRGRAVAPGLPAGRFGLADLGTQLQDVLLQQKDDDLDGKRNMILQTGNSIQQQILDAINKNAENPGGLTA